MDRTKLSKALSHLLRHGLLENGIEYRPDGYVRVDDLKRAGRARGGLSQASLQDLQSIVRTCSKQRFSLIEEGIGTSEGSTWWIRANQGHTVPGIDPEQVREGRGGEGKGRGRGETRGEWRG